MKQLIANLDCEARWAKRELPRAVRQRLAAMAPLMRALVDAEACTIVAPDVIQHAWNANDSRLPAWQPA